MTRLPEDVLDSRFIRPIRHIQLAVALVIYAYAYLAADPVGRGSVSLGDASLHALGTALLFLSVFVATRDRLGLWAMIALAGLVSFGLEYAQSFAPLRHFDWADLLMNALGIVTGAAVILLLYRLGWLGRI